MKYLNYFNEGLISSIDGHKLVNILRRYIEVDYIEGPFGTEGESIEVRFNNKDRVYGEKIRSIIRISGWYASKLNGGRFVDSEGIVGKIEFKPKFGFGVLSKSPKILYHVSPSKYKSKILKQGLKPLSGNKVDNYPDRIFVTDNERVAILLSKDLSRYTGDKEYILWSIDTNKITTDFKLYIDSTVSYGHSYYIQGVNIPPYAINELSEINL